MYIWLVHRLCFFYIKAKCAITFAIILFRKTGVSKVLSFCIFCPCFPTVFVYIAHFTGFFKIRIAFFPLLLYNTNQKSGALNRLLNIKHSAAKNKHSTYNNMKEGDFLMKYGHFDDVHQEYVITTPKTPLPWINYLGCNEFSV